MAGEMRGIVKGMDDIGGVVQGETKAQLVGHACFWYQPPPSLCPLPNSLLDPIIPSMLREYWTAVHWSTFKRVSPCLHFGSPFYDPS